ncbi:MAG: hypothetical protein JSU68_07350 [Phycisphaerales bacterium]|nr:MAG: hypothetical protein JSU68_07350 [Phycisphaerales bacterium]
MSSAWAWVVVLVSLGVWASYWAVLRDDHYQLIYVGQRLLDGGTYYIDSWENKPPGIAWINATALALAGGRPLGAWIAPGVVAVAVLALTAWGVSRVLGRVAAIGLLFTAGVVMTMRVHDAPSINPDFYSAAFALAAVTLFVVALSARARAGRAGLALLAGLMWAGAT